MMQLDSPVAEVRKRCAKEVHDAKDCCLDIGCTRKAKKLGVDVPKLLEHKGIRSTMRMWKRKAMFCNMST